MTFGFIISRHVNNEPSNSYWKECYKCIRALYSEPILIIDDSSDRNYVSDDIELENATIVYDTEHKGAAELLPYYYFHKLKPFDTAVIVHDTWFIQKKINFELEPQEKVMFFWTFSHRWDNEIFSEIDHLLKDLPLYEQHVDRFRREDSWIGCFGVMSVIRWSFLDTMNSNLRLFELLLPKIKTRENRYALERVFPLLIHSQEENIQTYFGDIHKYIRWGITFSDYKSGNFPSHPVVKTWSRR